MTRSEEPVDCRKKFDRGCGAFLYFSARVSDDQGADWKCVFEAGAAYRRRLSNHRSLERIMYYHRFGLAAPAFESISSDMAVFLSTPYREAFAAMEWGLLHEASGFSLLIGEPGTGKTTLINALVAQNRESVHTVFVRSSRLCFDEIVSLILQRLGYQDVPNTGLGLLRAIELAIAALKPNERVVVIVDEAQSLDDARMEDLRLISNCDGNHPRRLHFILAGQPELLERLRAPALRNLNQRIGARAKLVALNHNEAWDYVDYRLKQQGGSAERIFNRLALRRLIAASGGILRQINLLCTAALECANAQNERVVTRACARAAVAEYRNLHRARRTFYRRFAAAGLVASVTAVAAVAVAAVLAVHRRPSPGLQPVPPQTQFEPTIEMGGSIATDAPAAVDVARAPEIALRSDLEAGTANGDAARRAKPSSDASTAAATVLPAPGEASPTSRLNAPFGDVSEPGSLGAGAMSVVPAVGAPEVQADAVSSSHAATEANSVTRSSRRKHATRARSREGDSYRPNVDDEEPPDPSDSPPIEPGDTSATSSVE